MKPSEILEKVGKERLQAAMAEDNPAALLRLFEEEGVELTDEQLERRVG